MSLLKLICIRNVYEPGASENGWNDENLEPTTNDVGVSKFWYRELVASK